jgi:cytochrome c2
LPEQTGGDGRCSSCDPGWHACACCFGLQRGVQPRPLPVDGDPAAGAAAIRKYGCGTCHTVPGIRGADATVGPPLDHYARRVYVAGVVPNTPDDLVRWIQYPRQVDPRTAMPDMGVTKEDARDIAAYLYTATGARP